MHALCTLRQEAKQIDTKENPLPLLRNSVITPPPLPSHSTPPYPPPPPTHLQGISFLSSVESGDYVLCMEDETTEGRGLPFLYNHGTSLRGSRTVSFDYRPELLNNHDIFARHAKELECNLLALARHIERRDYVLTVRVPVLLSVCQATTALTV